MLFRNGGGLILSVLGAALIVWLLERREQKAVYGGDRRDDPTRQGRREPFGL